MNPSPVLRAIPSVEKLLQALDPLDLPRPAVVAAIRRELASVRGEIKSGPIPDFNAVLARVRGALEDLWRSRIQPVINGTGVIIHTNLGRAPLAASAVATLADLAVNYNNLEYDLATGERGARAGYLEGNLALLCAAEAVAVVNNCAAALVLVVRHFTRRAKKEVVISRGELIQIGGGFRIPEILEASGAKLKEGGTTNKTDAADYAAALGLDTALVLKVHRSNFYQGGFTVSPDAAELAALARKARVPFVEDLGSGAVVATESQAAGVEHERTPAEALRDGADLVCCSGDKLFGGPQAGLIAGRRKWIAALKREPFFRALRCDKLILGALQATVDHHLANRSDEIPVFGLLRVSSAELRARAENIASALGDLPLHLRIVECAARIGGGTLPRARIPSVALALAPQNHSLAAIAARLRLGSPPVIGYISTGRLLLDLRTIFPRQDEILVRAIHSLFR